MAFTAACSNQEPKLDYNGLKIGEQVSKFKERYPDHECEKKENLLCHSISGEVLVEVNSDEKIYKLQAASLIEELTFNQVIATLSKKYGEPKQISQQEPKTSLWCLNPECSKKIHLLYERFTLKSKKDSLKDEDFRELNICDFHKFFEGKCDKSFNYIIVTYKDEKLATLWIDKRNTELKKF